MAAIKTPKHRLTQSRRGGQPVGWVKRINGRVTWICSISQAPTAESADAWYERHFNELWAQDPDPSGDGEALTLARLVDLFIDRKRRAGLKPKTLLEYEQVTDDLCAGLGGGRPVCEIQPQHLGKLRVLWAKRFGVYRLAKYLITVRGMFKWALGPAKLLSQPVDLGDEFQLPTRADFRRRRKERRETRGLLLFTAREVRAQLDAASPEMRAMILLGLNCGFGNTDLAELPRSVIDLASGAIDYARGKTGADRRAFLWPQTVAAIKAVPQRKAARPEWSGLLFLTRRGHPYVLGRKDQIGMQYGALLTRLRQRRGGRSFYSLRRTFRTLADRHDSRAADLVMGHVTDADMGGHYVQRIDDARLQAISRLVRNEILGAWRLSARKAKPRARDAACAAARPPKTAPPPRA